MGRARPSVTKPGEGLGRSARFRSAASVLLRLEEAKSLELSAPPTPPPMFCLCYRETLYRVWLVVTDLCERLTDLSGPSSWHASQPIQPNSPNEAGSGVPKINVDTT